MDTNAWNVKTHELYTKRSVKITLTLKSLFKHSDGPEQTMKMHLHVNSLAQNTKPSVDAT